jgi:sugar phosphate isomerase/epimerase
MWSRRSFLKHASFTVASMATLDAYGASAKTGPLGKPIGIQLYTVAADAAKDLPGTLKALADIGYREVEFPGGPARMPAPQLRKLLTDLGLVCPSIHAAMSELQTNAQEKIDLARGLGAQYVVCSFPWTSDGRFQTARGKMGPEMTLDDWKWNAEQLNRIGELARQGGIRLGYHNHNLEFRSYGGTVAFDELLRLTDPKLVAIQLDIAWVATAGVDPLRYLRDQAARVELLHVKEVRKDLQVMVDQVKAQTTELGRGLIDWPKLFAAMDPKHVRHYFVEQENFDGSPLDAVRVDFDYLYRLGSKG